MPKSDKGRSMQKILKSVADVAGIGGILLCVFAGFARILGTFHIAGYESLTLFSIGMGGMIFSILLKLDVLLREIRRPPS
jgi:hypothetical protein